jgi:hypothetical protein
VGREKGRGRREERRRTEEKGNGGMGEGRAARNCCAVAPRPWQHGARSAWEMRQPASRSRMLRHGSGRTNPIRQQQERQRTDLYAAATQRPVSMTGTLELFASSGPSLMPSALSGDGSG